MNTGSVGGKEGVDGAKKVKIPHSSAVVKSIAEQTIKWTGDDDFGYEVAEDVPGIDDPELLQPRRLYEREGRLDAYDATVQRLKAERAEALATYPHLTGEIAAAVG